MLELQSGATWRRFLFHKVLIEKKLNAYACRMTRKTVQNLMEYSMS